ncbi:MAG: glutathione S-transferase family protein [Bdellovibrionales bacterium]|nr:glutathione S-transferase family protein [Oligoflexia bacterium]
MLEKHSLELISFDICPYVQRSVILLKRKQVAFKLTFIDLENTPSWFNEISPLGKVPLLLVRKQETDQPIVLFESAAINEYIDAVTEPALRPHDPLERAHESAWIAVSSDLLMGLYTVMMSKDFQEVEEAESNLWDTLIHVEKQVNGGSSFSSRGFSLVDAAFAPFFMRMMMLKRLRSHENWLAMPKILSWARALLALPEVRESVVPQFKARYLEMLRAHESTVLLEID